MSRCRHATSVKLTKKEKEKLKLLIAQETAPQWDVMARIALWAHEGHSNTVIAREVGIGADGQHVAQAHCTARRTGIREGERSGRPPRIAQEARLQLIALACEAQEPQGRLTPTLDEIVARNRARHRRTDQP